MAPRSSFTAWTSTATPTPRQWAPARWWRATSRRAPRTARGSSPHGRACSLSAQGSSSTASLSKTTASRTVTPPCCSPTPISSRAAPRPRAHSSPPRLRATAAPPPTLPRRPPRCARAGTPRWRTAPSSRHQRSTSEASSSPQAARGVPWRRRAGHSSSTSSPRRPSSPTVRSSPSPATRWTPPSSSPTASCRRTAGRTSL
mmetsp:Transcript_15540/g.36772  ORF Transcript_15540/g.36772 Transcript_15540/m.36772 type:complete len:201 (+) Transcript_15540:479-1081(+)